MKSTYSFTRRVWIATCDHAPRIHSEEDVCWTKPSHRWVRETPQMRWERATVVINFDPPKQKKPLQKKHSPRTNDTK